MGKEKEDEDPIFVGVMGSKSAAIVSVNIKF